MNRISTYYFHLEKYPDFSFNYPLNSPFDKLHSINSLYMHDTILPSPSQIFINNVLLLYCILLPKIYFINYFSVVFSKYKSFFQKSLRSSYPSPLIRIKKTYHQRITLRVVRFYCPYRRIRFRVDLKILALLSTTANVAVL